MKLHGVIALSLIVIVSDCFGGFGKGTLVKAFKNQTKSFCGDDTGILKKSMAFGMLCKRNKEVRVPNYEFTRASHFPYGEEYRKPSYNPITLKEEPVEELVGIQFTKKQTGSINLDIICHGSQQFYRGTSYSNGDSFPTSAWYLEADDSLICLNGTDIKAKKIHKIYTIYNDQGTVIVPQAKEPLWILVSNFGVVSYIPATVEITEEH